MAQSKKHGITINEFQEGLKRKQIAPLYFFYGDEDFLIEEAVEDLKVLALDEANRGFNLDLVYGGEIEAKDIISYATMFPMMGERKMMIVRDFDKLPEKDALIPYLEDPSSSTVLVLVSAAADFRLKCFKILETKAVTVGFEGLKDYQIPAWLKNRIEKKGKSISPEALQLMHIYGDTSLREIQNEIEKLFTYLGSRTTIEVEDIHAVTGVTREYNVFELQKAIGSRDISRSFEILNCMLESGENANAILASLTKYFQKIWVVQEMRQKGKSVQDIAKYLNINPQYPKFVEEYTQAASRFSSFEFERVFSSLIDADRKSKTSGGDIKLVMTVLLYNIINKGISEAVA